MLVGSSLIGRLHYSLGEGLSSSNLGCQISEVPSSRYATVCHTRAVLEAKFFSLRNVFGKVAKLMFAVLNA